jgi:hypothetical protein
MRLLVKILAKFSCASTRCCVGVTRPSGRVLFWLGVTSRGLRQVDSIMPSKTYGMAASSSQLHKAFGLRPDEAPPTPSESCTSRAHQLHPISTSRSTKAREGHDRWAASVVSTMDEMDPLLTVLEHARDVAQQKYLRFLEDSIIHVEFAAFFTTLREEEAKMFEVDEHRPRRVPWVHINEEH